MTTLDQKPLTLNEFNERLDAYNESKLNEGTVFEISIAYKPGKAEATARAPASVR